MPHKANKIQINNIKYFILKSKYNIYSHKYKSKKQNMKKCMFALRCCNYNLLHNGRYDILMIIIRGLIHV